MNSEFLSIKEVAVIFGVHPITIRRAIAKGHIKAIRLSEKNKSPYRISRKLVQAIHENQLLQHYGKR